MIVYITLATEPDRLVEYMKSNPDKCKWVNELILFDVRGKLHMSGIEFFDKEECMMACLRFSLVKYVENEKG